MRDPLHASPENPDLRATGVVLAIDYGRKRIGLALSDELAATSRPHATWARTNRRRDLARLRELVGKYAVRRIVVGLPLHLDGTPSEMSSEARRFAARVKKALGIPVEMMDERLSSWEAQQTLSSSNILGRPHGSSRQGAKHRRVRLDEIAAAVILRDYLEGAHSRSASRT